MAGQQYEARSRLWIHARSLSSHADPIVSTFHCAPALIRRLIRTNPDEMVSRFNLAFDSRIVLSTTRLRAENRSVRAGGVRVARV